MGTLASLMGTALFSQGANLALNELSGGGRRAQEKAALNQLKAQQTLHEQQLAKNAALEKQQVALNAKEAEGERKRALRRAVSRQRASFGAQGVGSGTGSSQAVLLGMFEESDEERQKRKALDNLRLTAIDQDISQKKSLNVLQRTQLQEKNKLASLSRKNDLFSNLF